MLAIDCCITTNSSTLYRSKLNCNGDRPLQRRPLPNWS